MRPIPDTTPLAQDAPAPQPKPAATTAVRPSSRVEQPDVARMLNGLRVMRATYGG